MSVYRTICADPPWPGVTARSGVGGRRRHATTIPYALMPIAAIQALPVADFADPVGCHLFLWTTRKLFRDGDAAAITRAWGFEPVGELIWGLRNPGFGGFLANDHEPVLIARRGDARFSDGVRCGGVHFWRQVYNGAHGKVHSAKPEGFYDLVEQVSPGPYLELFARRQRLGWDTWGDECFRHVELGA